MQRCLRSGEQASFPNLKFAELLEGMLLAGITRPLKVCRSTAGVRLFIENNSVELDKIEMTSSLCGAQRPIRLPRKSFN